MEFIGTHSSRPLRLIFHTCPADLVYLFFFFFQNKLSFCASQHTGAYNSDYPIVSYGRMSYAVHNELRLQVMQFFSNYISFGALWRHTFGGVHVIEKNECQSPEWFRLQQVKVSNMKPCISKLIQMKFSQKGFKQMFNTK